MVGVLPVIAVVGAGLGIAYVIANPSVITGLFSGSTQQPQIQTTTTEGSSFATALQQIEQQIANLQLNFASLAGSGSSGTGANYAPLIPAPPAININYPNPVLSPTGMNGSAPTTGAGIDFLTTLGATAAQASQIVSTPLPANLGGAGFSGNVSTSNVNALNNFQAAAEAQALQQKGASAAQVQAAAAQLSQIANARAVVAQLRSTGQLEGQGSS